MSRQGRKAIETTDSLLLTMNVKGEGNRHATTAGKRRYRQVLGLGLGLAVMLLAACGSNDEASPQAVSEENLEVGEAAVRAVLKTSGLDVKTEDGAYVIGYEDEDTSESARIGQNLPVPEWLPKGFPLPADLSIQLITVDADGLKTLQGSSAEVEQAEIAPRIAEWSSDYGWELISANDFRIILVSANEDVIDVYTDEQTGLSLEMSKRPVAWDRQEAAIETKTPGLASLTLADKTSSMQGECTIKGTSYGFEYYSPDGTGFGTVQIQSAESGPQGLASFQTIGGASSTRHAISFPMGSGEEPVVQASGKEFSVRGQFSSFVDGSMQAVPGVVSVRCE